MLSPGGVRKPTQNTLFFVVGAHEEQSGSRFLCSKTKPSEFSSRISCIQDSVCGQASDLLTLTVHIDFFLSITITIADIGGRRGPGWETGPAGTILGGSQGGIPSAGERAPGLSGGDWPGDDDTGLLRVRAPKFFFQNIHNPLIFSEKWLPYSGRVSGTPSAGMPAPGLPALIPLYLHISHKFIFLESRSIPGRRSVKTAPGRIWRRCR